MKKTYILTLMILLAGTASALAQQLTFTYDAAGNQTKREWICTTCLAMEEQAEIKVQQETAAIVQKRINRKSRKERKPKISLSYETSNQNRMPVGPPDHRT